MPRSQFPIRNSHWWTDHTSKSHRPPWWPENEDWPPHSRSQWRRFRKNNPFFRRLGCLFALFTLVGLIFFLLLAGLVLNALGIVHISLNVQSLVPLSGLLLAVLIALVVLVGANLRRMSIPLDDLLAASSRVAEGDYSARVEERGPTEVRSLSRAFNSMTSRLQIQDKQRRSMLADVTHELRTPLTIIQGNLEGVLDGVYPADKKMIMSILVETQVLSRLTDDLRTLALAESGSMQLRREQTDLVQITQETVTAFESQAIEVGVPIVFFASKSECILNIDPERIRQVLTNLISNALRYSPKGSQVRVSVDYAVVSGAKRVVVSVADNGPGIPIVGFVPRF